MKTIASVVFSPLAAIRRDVDEIRRDLEATARDLIDSFASAAPATIATGNVNVSHAPGPQSETDIAIDPTNPQHLIAGSNDYAGANVQARVYESQDGGKSWTSALLPAGPAPFNDGAGDPSVTFDASGNAYYSHLALSADGHRSLVCARKAAGATSWDSPVVIPNVNADKDLIACDRTNSAFRGNVYVGWHNGQWQNGRFQQDVMVATSRDGGRTFTPVKVNNSGTHVGGAATAIGPNGEVYTLWGNWNDRSYYLNRSVDGGKTWGSRDLPVHTWTANTHGSNGVQIPAAPRGVGFFPSIDVDRSNGPNRGAIYVAYSDGTNGLNVFVQKSIDGGVTWSKPVRVNDDAADGGDGHDHFFPRIAVDESDGSVNLVWYDTRNDPGNTKTDVYYARSIDGGLSFGPNARITTASTDETAPGASDESYGDYLGIAASGGVVHPIWTDGRAGNSAEDVYTDTIINDDH